MKFLSSFPDPSSGPPWFVPTGYPGSISPSSNKLEGDPGMIRNFKGWVVFIKIPRHWMGCNQFYSLDFSAKIANIGPTFCFPKDSSGSWCFVAFVFILMIAANTVIIKTMFNDLFLGSYHFHFSTTFFPAFLSFPPEKKGKNSQVTYQIGGSGSGVTVGLGVLSWGLFGGCCWYWSNGVWWQISTKPWKPRHSKKTLNLEILVVPSTTQNPLKTRLEMIQAQIDDSLWQLFFTFKDFNIAWKTWGSFCW